MSNLKLPSKNEIRLAIASFYPKERKFFYVLALIFLVSAVIILEKVNKSFMVDIPIQGGSITEGVIDAPRFVNPVLAFNEADQDLVSLIYSGLMHKNQNGTLTPNLAEKVDESKDGLEYTFTLKNKIYFHDKTPVTAGDVVFTINQVKDPIIKSPRKVNWEGVNVEKIDDRTVKFTLKRPNSSFLENATLGIMPEHLWQGTPLELNNANVNPIGSGPYMLKKVSKQSSGTVDSYQLESYKKFNLGEPYLRYITLRFYQNEDELIAALENGKVDQIDSITPKNAEVLKEKGYRVESSVLPRIFGLFFNQSQNQIFTDKKVVMAIDLAIDKDKIVRDVLAGYGVTIDSPIPKNMIVEGEEYIMKNQNEEKNIIDAKDMLVKGGWTLGEDGFLEKITTSKLNKKTNTPLEFSISTGNVPELVEAAKLIEQDLEKIGMKVEVKTFDIGNLNQSVIRPRKYDILLFGQTINQESDLFAFWHSSQRKDPGLNIALYTNAKVDKILEDAFITVDPDMRTKKYIQFEEEIKKDMPAVFLYSPDFIYLVPKELKNLSIEHIISPSDRFLNSYLWYTQKDNVWKIFSNK